MPRKGVANDHGSGVWFGRHAQLVDGGYSFWVYRHSGAAHPRLDHLSWNGVALPPDHPFWQTHYPPNGWGCGCLVYGARSARGIRRVGGDPDKALPDGWQAVDPRTGAPKGVGRGWAYAPGASVSNEVRVLTDKTERLPTKLSADLIRSMMGPRNFGRWMKAPEVRWPVARLSDADIQRLEAEANVAHLSAETMRKQLRQHPELTLEDYQAIQDTVDGAAHRLLQTPSN